MPDSELITQLKSLLRGLWLPSETEAPWTMPTWTLESDDATSIRQALRREADAPLAEISLETLIEQVQRRCRGYGDEGKAIAAQHQALAKFLQDHCDRVHVFRVGEVTVDVVIWGKATDEYLVLQTQSVET
jgi:hypothetical protein